MSQPLPAETQTLFAELNERLLGEAARRSVGKAPGTFTTKKIGGEPYVYFQYSLPGGTFKQLYLGKKTPGLERLIERFSAERVDAAAERASLERLCAQIVAGGAWTMGHGPSRVLKAFADAGVFEAGTVIVGTHAFGILGNALGTRWESGNLRTHDLDLAAVSLAAAPERGSADAEDALRRLEMGFLPVPGLDPRHASTSFKVRGQALRVDFLTPGKGGAPVPIPALGTSAQPLPFLEYLLENPERQSVVDGGGILVLVPNAARFALHKILVSAERPSSQHAKGSKDLLQASEILLHLRETRPGDLRLAADALADRGWSARLRRAAKPLAKLHAQAYAALDGLAGI